MEHRIFKGATRPPMFMGVPLMPMVILSVTTIPPLGLLFIIQKYIPSLMLLTVFLAVFIWMRLTTKHDPWRTKQEVLRFRMRYRRGNPQIWGGMSYAPYKLRPMKLLGACAFIAMSHHPTDVFALDFGQHLNAKPHLSAISQTSIALPSAGTLEVAFSPNEGSEELVTKVLQSARNEIRVLAYSFTSPAVVSALLNAKRKGVDIKVVVDSKNNITQDSSGKARAALSALANAGIDVRTIDTYSIHHDKVLIVDRETVELGSFNYSSAAALRNSENVLVNWHNPQLAATYLKHFQRNYAQSVSYRIRY
jgi:type IV secretory pathway VirB3-like protein/HKD family nuclease